MEKKRVFCIKFHLFVGLICFSNVAWAASDDSVSLAFELSLGGEYTSRHFLGSTGVALHTTLGKLYGHVGLEAGLVLEENDSPELQIRAPFNTPVGYIFESSAGWIFAQSFQEKVDYSAMYGGPYIYFVNRGHTRRKRAHMLRGGFRYYSFASEGAVSGEQNRFKFSGPLLYVGYQLFNAEGMAGNDNTWGFKADFLYGEQLVTKWRSEDDRFNIRQEQQDAGLGFRAGFMVSSYFLEAGWLKDEIFIRIGGVFRWLLKP